MKRLETMALGDGSSNCGVQFTYRLMNIFLQPNAILLVYYSTHVSALLQALFRCHV